MTLIIPEVFIMLSHALGVRWRGTEVVPSQNRSHSAEQEHSAELRMQVKEKYAVHTHAISPETGH